MALDFGKLNFNVSFNPTSAFPIDARGYFENLDDAVNAAKTAEQAGSKNTKYYFGQNISVVENDKANLYIVQPDGTLGEVGGKVDVNNNIFSYNANQQLELLGFANAASGAQLVKSADGKISWVVPDVTTVEGLTTAVTTLRTDVDNLTTNTYTKTQVDTLIANSDHLRRKIVTSIDDIDLSAANADKFIYMVGNGLSDYDDKYQEYMIIDGRLEPVGTWEVKLDNYVTLDDLNTALLKKVDAVDGSRLITNEEATKLFNIEEGAQKNFISEVEENFFTVTTGKLFLNNLPQSKIIGLEDALNNKVGVEDGKGLSTNDFTDELKTKLENLNLNDISNLQTSINLLDQTVFGYTTTEEETGEEIQILGLDDHIVNLQNDVSILQGNVSTLDNSVLDLGNRVNTLETTVSAFPDTYVSITNFNATVGVLDELLLKENTISQRIDVIEKKITWQDL